MTEITRLLENGKEILKFLKDFTTGAIGDVSIVWKNADGTTTTYTFPSIAKFTNDVKVAIKGEMYRVVYLDETQATNGDGTQASPYSSLAAVLNDMPYSSRRSVYVVGTLNLKSSASTAINNKTISLIQADSTSKVYFDSDSTQAPVSVFNKGVLLLMIDTNIINTYDTIRRRAINVFDSGYVGVLIKNDGNIPTFTMGDNTSIMWLRNKATASMGAIDFIDANKTNVQMIEVRLGEIYVEPNLSRVQFNSVSSADWATLQTEIASRVGGVVKVNSVPTNVFSNAAL